MTACTGCGADNPAAARFCSACGTPLVRSCPSCGAAVTGRFCGECGTPVDESATNRPAAPAEPARPPSARTVQTSERRITSVLFGDLVGFTTLSENRDPDDVRELLSRYFATCRTIIERYGGMVEKFIGDAVMAVWGVPVAHEDDAERAVRAGLDLADAIAALGEETGLSGLAMRVGVVTGEVAVNVGATGEGMVAGDAVNTASRVQSAANPGKVWVDDQTRELTAAAVAYDDHGEHELKGKAEPMRLFEARQVVATVGGARRVDGLEAPFCGRDREVRLVKELFHATLEEGRPRLVAVFGAAGVGKSRLGWEFEKYSDGINNVVMVHRGRCLSYGDGVAFWALAEVVRGRLRILEGDPNDVVVERLRAGLEVYVPDGEDREWLLPRMATLLGVVDLVSPGASFARDDLFAAWRTFLERVARDEEAVGAMVQIDDLQWADPGMLDFITHVLDHAQAPIFILTLARSELAERVPGFGNGRRATALYLEPLPDQSMATLVDGLVDGLPTTLRDTLVERSEGIPLFAVETVRALIDRDAVVPHEGRYVLAADAAQRIDLADRSLPTSLHTLIASRLDGLPAHERRVVQDAAVLGQSFSSEGLSALLATVGETGDMSGALASLVRKEIFAIESDPRSAEHGQYRFVQAMVRTVAYDTLARRDRKARHLAAARFLAEEPDADSIPAVLASHYLDAYSAAGQDEDAAELAACAVELLERAASRARDLGAPAEARRHLETALQLVTEPVEIGRLSEAAAEAALSAGASGEAATLADRARETYAGAGLEIDAARALALWGDVHISAGTGPAVIEPLSGAYESLHDRPEAAATAARLALGVARAYYLSVGDSESAIPWFDRAVTLGEALEDLPMLASTLASYSGALVLVGRSHMGLGLLRVSLEIARETGDPSAQLRSLNNLVSFLSSRDVGAAIGYADQSLAIARRLGDREWAGYLTGSAAHAYWNAGDWDSAVAVAAEWEFGDEDMSPVVALTVGYVAAIHEACGLPVSVGSISEAPTGQRADLMMEAAGPWLSAFVARATGDSDGAAAFTSSALDKFVEASGIDDDFPLIWVTAISDQLAVRDAAAARGMLALVEEAPRGHIPTLTRALLPWQRARVKVLEGDDDGVDASFAAAEAGLRDFGARFYLGRALLDHADWLQARDRAAAAVPLLEEARQIFAGLGAAPWLERAGGEPTADVGRADAAHLAG